MLSIFSCTYYLPVCLLWKNVYSDLLPISLIGFFFFLILSCMICLHILDINLFSVISFANIFFYRLSFSFVDDFFCCAKSFKLDSTFCFYFFCFRRTNPKSIAVICVKECSTYILLEEFYSFRSYIYVLNPF